MALTKIKTGSVSDSITLTAPTVNGGTHTSFTSTGIDDNATSNAITIDSNQNVTLGVPNSVNLSGATTELTLGDTGNTDNDGFGISFVHNTTELNAYVLGQKSAMTLGTVGATPVNIVTNNDARMVIAADGNVGISSVPDSWAALTSLDISQSASLAGHDSQNAAYFMNNLYFNGLWRAKNTGASSGIILDNVNNYIGFYHNASVSADTTVTLQQRMVIDNSGRVTMPSQPHWRGYITRAAGGAGVADSSSNQDVRGSGLTFTNSRVTVPVAGVYQVNFNAILGDGSNALRYDAYLTVNGTSIVESLNDLATGFHYRNISIAVEMAANDYLEFYCQAWYSYGNANTWKTASVTLIS